MSPSLWFRNPNRELKDDRFRLFFTVSETCAPSGPFSDSSGSSMSGVVARVKVEDVGDMGMEHVVAESGMMDELMVDEVGERSR